MDLIISPCAQLLTLAGDPAPIQSLQMILSLACTQMRMTPAEAIVAATINGAHALGRADRLGSLEPGKQADICIMDVEDYRQISYYFGMNHYLMTIKKARLFISANHSPVK